MIFFKFNQGVGKEDADRLFASIMTILQKKCGRELDYELKSEGGTNDEEVVSFTNVPFFDLNMDDLAKF